MKLLKIFLVPVFVCFLAVIACHKADNHAGVSTPKSAITISGFELLDFGGNFAGWQGTPDSDWLFRPGLSAAEMNVFNFNTKLSLLNTAVDTVSGVLAYPDPVSIAQSIYCNIKDSNVIKVVYVDSMLTVLKDTAVKGKGVVNFQLLLTDATLFPNHSSRRIYFSLTANGHPDYAVGYGDVRICDQTSGSGNCF